MQRFTRTSRLEKCLPLQLVGLLRALNDPELGLTINIIRMFTTSFASSVYMFLTTPASQYVNSASVSHVFTKLATSVHAE